MKSDNPKTRVQDSKVEQPQKESQDPNQFIDVTSSQIKNEQLSSHNDDQNLKFLKTEAVNQSQNFLLPDSVFSMSGASSETFNENATLSPAEKCKSQKRTSIKLLAKPTPKSLSEYTNNANKVGVQYETKVIKFITENNLFELSKNQEKYVKITYANELELQKLFEQHPEPKFLFSKIHLNEFYTSQSEKSIRISAQFDIFPSYCHETFENVIQTFENSPKKGDAIIIPNFFQNQYKQNDDLLICGQIKRNYFGEITKKHLDYGKQWIKREGIVLTQDQLRIRVQTALLIKKIILARQCEKYELKKNSNRPTSRTHYPLAFFLFINNEQSHIHDFKAKIGEICYQGLKRVAASQNVYFNLVYLPSEKKKTSQDINAQEIQKLKVEIQKIEQRIEEAHKETLMVVETKINQVLQLIKKRVEPGISLI